jgi:hypothetical protein
VAGVDAAELHFNPDGTIATAYPPALLTKEDGERFERRLADVETRLDAQKHCGVWHAAARYTAGNTVTHDGSTWRCNTDNTGVRPNAPPHTAWTLVTKRGADAPNQRAEIRQLKREVATIREALREHGMVRTS